MQHIFKKITFPKIKMDKSYAKKNKFLLKDSLREFELKGICFLFDKQQVTFILNYSGKNPDVYIDDCGIYAVRTKKRNTQKIIEVM